MARFAQNQSLATPASALEAHRAPNRQARRVPPGPRAPGRSLDVTASTVGTRGPITRGTAPNIACILAHIPTPNYLAF